MKKIQILICNKFGHDCIANNNQMICVKCHTKWIYNSFKEEWEEIDSFPNESKTDKQLIKSWKKEI